MIYGLGCPNSKPKWKKNCFKIEHDFFKEKAQEEVNLIADSEFAAERLTFHDPSRYLWSSKICFLCFKLQGSWLLWNSAETTFKVSAIYLGPIFIQVLRQKGMHFQTLFTEWDHHAFDFQPKGFAM